MLSLSRGSDTAVPAGGAQAARSLAARRERLRERDGAWRRDVEEDAELYAILGDGLRDAHQPSARELTMLHQSLTAPGAGDSERAPVQQLVQLLRSPEPGVLRYALTELLQELTEREAAPAPPGEELAYHLSGAVRPLVSIVAAGEPREGADASERAAVYWHAVALLQLLCADEQHALAVSDAGCCEVLLALIDSSPPGAASLETEVVNCTAIQNVLNALWLLACYEGGGDLASYDEEQGPVVSLLLLLRQLRGRPLTPTDSRRRQLRDEFFFADEPNWEADEALRSDVVLVVLEVIRRLARLKTYRGAVTAAGGIEQCTALLHPDCQHPGGAGPLRRVAAAEIIALLMVDNSVEFVVLGGVGHVAELLASPFRVEHDAALGLLLHVFSVRGDYGALVADLVAGGALGVCCRLMGSEQPATRRRALRLLCLLCQHGGEDYSQTIAQEHGVLAALVRLLRDDRLHVLQHATALLWYLMESAECSGQLLQHGGVPLLMRLAAQRDPVVRHNAQGCLRVLECFDDLGDDGWAGGADAPQIRW